MGKMIAKTIAGKEFTYSRESAHAVSNAGAEAICRALNEKRWGLKDGQVWHVYDCGWYEQEYTGAAYQQFIRRKGAIYEARN